MVMKTGGRYRRDNIPRGRVSRSRRCQRRQARPRRPRTSASRRCKTDLATAYLLHSLVPPFVPSSYRYVRYTCSRLRTCLPCLPACLYPLWQPIFPARSFRSFFPASYIIERIARYRAWRRTYRWLIVETCVPAACTLYTCSFDGV